MYRMLATWPAALLGAFWWGTAAGASSFPEFTELVERYGPAVVSIDVEAEDRLGPSPRDLPFPSPDDQDNPFYEYFKRFFDQLPERAPRNRPQFSKGSGFIISNDGYILTNAHVIEGGGQIRVGLQDQTQFTAEVVGVDPRTDVAMLKIETDRQLPAVQIGDPGKLKVGQWVLAIGSPFGLEATATQGIISALGRSLPRDSYVPFIQTDAAVNPGNSGGPLFNLDGEVIGVNSQIYSRTGGYMGVSFAIPIDVAMEVAEQLKTRGRVSRGWLGVMIQPVTPELAQSFGLDRPRGALVGQVFDNSPAQRAGLEPGDVIVAFGGAPVERSSELPMLVGRTTPNTDSSVRVIRDGEEQNLTVRLGELQDQPGRPVIGRPAPNPLRIQVDDLSPEQQTETGSKGVLVDTVEPDGPAARAGILEGDIITRINNAEVSNTSDFRQIVKALPTGKPVPVLVQREGGALFLALTLPPEP